MKSPVVAVASSENVDRAWCTISRNYVKPADHLVAAYTEGRGALRGDLVTFRELPSLEVKWITLSA